MMHRTRALLWGTGNQLEKPRVTANSIRGERIVMKVCGMALTLGGMYVGYQFLFRTALPTEVRSGRIVAKPAGEGNNDSLHHGAVKATKGESVQTLSAVDLVGKLQSQESESDKREIMVKSVEPAFIQNKREA